MPQRNRGFWAFVSFAIWVLLSGSAFAQKIVVTAADPNVAQQGTTSLVVKITGKNFAPGSQAKFFRSGTTDPGGITVRGTQFISVTEVDATVDVATGASLSLFDIQVTAPSRSGKGSDMFQVIQKSSSQPIYYTIGDALVFRDAQPVPGVAGSGDGVVSDGQSTYGNGVSSVSVLIYTGSSGDLVTTLGTRLVRAVTTPDRRVLNSGLSGPYPTTAIACKNVNVLDIWSIPVPAPGVAPTPVLRTAGFGCSGLTPNDLVQFGDHHNDGAGQFSTQVWVTRLSKTSWTVSTDPSQTQAVYSTQVSTHPSRTGFTAEFLLPFQIQITCSQCAGVN